MRFILDNNLSPIHALALNALSSREGCEVHHISEVFPRRDIPDENWLPALSHQGDWVVVSADMNIFKSPHLRQVWIESKLTTFFLHKGWLHQKFWDQAWWFTRWWPTFIEQARIMEAGTAFEVPSKSQGKLRLLPR